MTNKKQQVKKLHPSQAPNEKKNKKPGIKVLMT